MGMLKEMEAHRGYKPDHVIRLWAEYVVGKYNFEYYWYTVI